MGRFQVHNLQRQFVAFLETAARREEQVPDGRGEVVFYNLGKFSQAISDFESIHFHSKPVHKYASFAKFLEYQAEHAYPEGWQDSRYVTPDTAPARASGAGWENRSKSLASLPRGLNRISVASRALRSRRSPVVPACGIAE